MTLLTPLDPVVAPVVPRGAVVWLDGQTAIVASTDDDGRIDTTQIERGLDGEPPYLARVVHEIGERDRVVILGPGVHRLELEREYVAIFHRPDRLVDVERSGPVDARDLTERLRSLTAP